MYSTTRIRKKYSKDGTLLEVVDDRVLDSVKDRKELELHSCADNAILSMWPETNQRYAALGVFGDVGRDDCCDFIRRTHGELQRCLALVDRINRHDYLNESEACDAVEDIQCLFM